MRALAVVVLSGWFVSCRAPTDAARETYRTEYFELQFIDNRGLPQLYVDKYHITSATLVPYGAGRTIDQRIFNDRGGRGGTGGNTRDTTVLRGQFQDLRRLFFVFDQDTIYLTDSSIVEVELTDTVMIMTRPHPDPSRTIVDTAYFNDDVLVWYTYIDRGRLTGNIQPPIRKVFHYKIRK